jgi:hypothetical protein
MNPLALILLASCPLAADPVPAGTSCACSRDGNAWVEPAPVGHTGVFGRLRGLFHRFSSGDTYAVGVPGSQPVPARVVSPAPMPLPVGPAAARLPSTAEPPLAPGGGPNLAAVDH